LVCWQVRLQLGKPNKNRSSSQVVRASPMLLSMWVHTVKFIAKKAKCGSLAQEIGFFAPNSCSLPWLVTQLCTSKNECNKLDQYFWLVEHNDWSRWFATSSPHIYAIPVTILLVGLPKQTAKLRHLILLSRVT
jgi:hypothetical protein